MSPVHERNIPRLRVIMAFVADQVGTISKQIALDHVGSKIPPKDDDADVLDNGRKRWVNDLLWYVTTASGAGWLVPDGRGNWQITDKGRSALDQYQDPNIFSDTCGRIYRESRRQRKGQQRRSWLIRGSSVRGSNIVGEWLGGGWISLVPLARREVHDQVTFVQPFATMVRVRSAQGQSPDQPLCGTTARTKQLAPLDLRTGSGLG